MLFRIVEYRAVFNQYRNSIVLVKDYWNDWGFHTMFHCYYVTKDGNPISLNTIKIAKKGMIEGEYISNYLPVEFERLDNEYFSVWESAKTYEKIFQLGEKLGINIFERLNDIAYDLKLYQQVENEDVFLQSFLRGISSHSIKKQFHRIAQKGELLSPYSFKYHTNSFSEDMSFDIRPYSNPPTNIQAIIGRNGVGKTHLIKSMIQDICLWPEDEKEGFIYDKEESDFFEGVLCISFSPFDDLNIDQKKLRSKMRFDYLGIHEKSEKKNDGKKESEDSENNKEKTLDDIIKDCFISHFASVSLRDEATKEFKDLIQIIQDEYSDETINEINEILKINDFDAQLAQMGFFDNLSSGHKEVLSILAFCTDRLAEKSILFIDEPENHLHPPLLALLIRALSTILINRNSVALIATHSPVVLQNIPAKCVWVLDRQGNYSHFRRPRYETFGGNIGTLTSDVFGYTAEKCGFYMYLKQLAADCSSYEEALEKLEGEVGDEGRSVLFSCFN